MPCLWDALENSNTRSSPSIPSMCRRIAVTLSLQASKRFLWRSPQRVALNGVVLLAGRDPHASVLSSTKHSTEEAPLVTVRASRYVAGASGTRIPRMPLSTTLSRATRVRTRAPYRHDRPDSWVEAQHWIISSCAVHAFEGTFVAYCRDRPSLSGNVRCRRMLNSLRQQAALSLRRAGLAGTAGLVLRSVRSRSQDDCRGQDIRPVQQTLPQGRFSKNRIDD